MDAITAQPAREPESTKKDDGEAARGRNGYPIIDDAIGQTIDLMLEQFEFSNGPTSGARNKDH